MKGQGCAAAAAPGDFVDTAPLASLPDLDLTGNETAGAEEQQRRERRSRDRYGRDRRDRGERGPRDNAEETVSGSMRAEFTLSIYFNDGSNGSKPALAAGSKQ